MNILKKQKDLLTKAIILTSLFLTASHPFSPTSANTVYLSVDTNLERKPISPYIYGLNFAKESFANEIDLPARRWGGNATSRYNWQTNTLNSGNDWFFENSLNLNSYNWSQTENYEQWIEQNERTATDSLITIPMIGYVSKDGTNCGYSISKYGLQTASDPWKPNCGNGILLSNGMVVINDPADTSVVSDEQFMENWIEAMKTNHGTASNGGVKFFALDNEPELWSETHRDVHPVHQTYGELLSKTILYGNTIKSVDPTALTLGYSSFGWSGYWYSWNDLKVAEGNGYTYFPDYALHGNMHQVEWYLDSLRQYEANHGLRILDYLDLHYYPQNGVALQTAGGNTTQALRLRSTRSLWDPTYRDESWIGGNDQAEKYVKLIPRMHEWVDVYYPETKLAITEYNFGGLEHINGALTQAEILGIFGREGLDMAMLWNYPLPNGNDPLGYDHFETLPGSYAFRMYRNYDGLGGKFGDVSVSANSSDSSLLSVFAAQRTSDSALTLIVINKTSSTINGSIAISNFATNDLAQVYEFSPSNLSNITQKEDIIFSNGNINSAFNPNSITLLVIPEISKVPADWVGSVSITSNRNIVAVGRPHIGSEVASYNGFTSGSTTTYIPMLFKNAFGGAYDAALYIQNVSDINNASITIQYYDNTGNLNCTKNDTISPLASKGYWLPTTGCDAGSLPSGWAGGVKITSTQPIVAVGRPHIGSEVMTYSGFTTGYTTAYIPMLFNGAFGGSYNAAFYVQNIGNSSATYTIQYYDSTGALNCTKTGETLAQYASRGYWVPASTCDSGSLPNGWVGGVRITSDQPIVTVGRPHIDSQITTYGGSGNGFTMQVLPMLFKGAFGGTYNSAFYVQNTSSDTGEMNFNYYDTNGVSVCQKTHVSIPPKASLGVWVPAATCSTGSLPDGWRGSVVITSTQNIIAIGRPHIATQVTTYNGSQGGLTTAFLPMLFKTAFDGSYDSAIYIQDINGNGTTELTLKFYDTNGNLTCTHTNSIVGNSVLGLWLPDIPCSP